MHDWELQGQPCVDEVSWVKMAMCVSQRSLGKLECVFTSGEKRLEKNRREKLSVEPDLAGGESVIRGNQKKSVD